MNSNSHAAVPVNVAVSEDVLKKIWEHVLSGYPGEVCGILLGNIEVITAGMVDISDYVPLDNAVRGDAAHKSFLIDSLEFYQMERQWLEKGSVVAGFCHSHPDCRAVPSQADVTAMIPGLVYLIVSVTDGHVMQPIGWHKKNAGNDIQELPVTVNR